MWSSKILHVTIIVLALTDVLCAQNDDPMIVFIASSTSQQTYGLSAASELLKNIKFDANRKAVFYIHGYVETIATPTTQTIINAYVQEGAHNLLVLDWSTLAGGAYTSAVANASELGPKIADTLINLFDAGFKGDIHIVGHSLGAHLGGNIGRNLIAKSNNAMKLQRLTGLDPAFPLYYPQIFGVQHINGNDAKFVDIIHTDAGGYGAPKGTGSVDFWVNGGRRIQPGCPVGAFMFLSSDDLCSHHRSVQLWAESVSMPSSTFMASLKRDMSVKNQMGLHCSTSVLGSYSIKTKSSSPYSMS